MFCRIPRVFCRMPRFFAFSHISRVFCRIPSSFSCFFAVTLERFVVSFGCFYVLVLSVRCFVFILRVFCARVFGRTPRVFLRAVASFGCFLFVVSFKVFCVIFGVFCRILRVFYRIPRVFCVLSYSKDILSFSQGVGRSFILSCFVVSVGLFVFILGKFRVRVGFLVRIVVFFGRLKFCRILRVIRGQGSTKILIYCL